jgi:hypothetical protein
MANVRRSGNLPMQRKPPVTEIEGHPTNTVHFACFDCRAAFKQPNSSNWDTRVAERPFDCPNCKQPMVRLGRYFKAPPKRAIRQWIKVELLFQYGGRFVSGNSRLDTKCDTIPSTVAYLCDCGHDASEVRDRLKCIRDARRPESSIRRTANQTRRTKR